MKTENYYKGVALYINTEGVREGERGRGRELNISYICLSRC